MLAIDWIPRTLLVLLLFAGCGGHRAPEPAAVPAAQPAASSKPVIAWSQGPLASSHVAASELVGLVVDAESGAPVALAQVVVNQWTPATSLVMTDSAGRFRMTRPNAGETLRIARIGYQPYATTIPRGDSGLVAVIALRPAMVGLCSVQVDDGAEYVDGNGVRHPIIHVRRHPGVVVIARDAFTGQAPERGITVLVRDSTFRDSVTVLPDSTGRVVANAALDREGRYDVVVRSPGYSDWSGSSETRPMPGCTGEFIPAVFHAWLIPR